VKVADDEVWKQIIKNYCGIIGQMKRMQYLCTSIIVKKTTCELLLNEYKLAL
jgi:hypothetical protein